MAKTSNDKLIWANNSLPNPLNDSEDILMVLREDIVILVFKIFVYLLVFLFATLIYTVLPKFIGTSALALSILGIAYHTFNILYLTAFILKFHDYYLSMQIVTDWRIIDISQNGLFGREVNELGFDKIEDVTHKQNGLLATIFNYGDIIVQTAASASSNTSGFVFKNIPNPSAAHKIIMDIWHQKFNENIPPVNRQTQPVFNPSNFNMNQNYSNPLPVKYREGVINHSNSSNENIQNN